MPLRLNVDEDGAVYLPWAKSRLIALKAMLNAQGLDHLMQTMPTPDGLGLIELRTQRLGKPAGTADPFAVTDPMAWQDYIRIEATVPRGFIFQPYLRRIDTDTVLIASSPPLWRLPLKGGAFRKFSGYTVEQMSNAPQVDGKHTTTGAAGDVFRDGALQRLSPLSVSLGKWLHQYTLSGNAASRILRMAPIGSGPTLNYVVADSVDGALAEGGVDRFTGNNGLFVTYGVSANGRNAIVDYGAVAKRYRLDMDYARAVPKITTTRFTDASPWGTWVQTTVHGGNLDGSPTAQSWTGLATFPATYGPSDIGSVRNEVQRGYPADLINTMIRSYGATEVDTAWNYARSQTLALPNGFKVFLMDKQIQFTSQVTDATVNYTGGLFIDGDPLQIIYSDPAVPVMIYRRAYTKRQADPSTFVVTPLPPPDVGFASLSGMRNIDELLDIGILIGTQHRVLFSKILSHSTESFNESDSPSFEIDITGGTGLPVPVTAFPANYLSQLREVVVPGGGDSPDRYVVDVRDVDNWVVGYMRLDGTPEFHLYAGTMNELDLRTNFVALLIKLLTAQNAASPDPVLGTAIADMQAGNFAPYDIRLNGVPPLNPSTPNPYEPRVGVASLV